MASTASRKSMRGPGSWRRWSPPGAPIPLGPEDDGHIVEIGEVGLEEGLADPVLTGVQHVVDPDLGGGDAAQRYGVFCTGIADRGSIPCGPGPERNARKPRLDPHLDRLAGGQPSIDRRSTPALAA